MLQVSVLHTVRSTVRRRTFKKTHGNDSLASPAYGEFFHFVPRRGIIALISADATVVFSTRCPEKACTLAIGFMLSRGDKLFSSSRTFYPLLAIFNRATLARW